MHDVPPHPHQNHDLAFATGGGDMGALLRTVDWSLNPLGPLETWPQSLRTAVSLMLGTRQPMYVAWGPGLQLLYNDAYRGLLGARADRPERVLGQRFDQVWADVWHEVGPMMRETLGGNAVHAEDHEFVLHRNGYPERMYATFSTIPLRDEAGRVAGVCCVCSETTSKVVSERRALAAAEANAKFRTFFEQGSQFSALMAPDGTLIEANHIALEGGRYRREDVIGQPFHACGWWSRSPQAIATVRDAIVRVARGDSVRCELPWFLADGEQRFTDMTMAPVTGDDGALLFIAATGGDITERRQVEERLRLLDAIGEATRVARDPKTIMSEATRLLGEHMGVTRVAYADLEPDNDCFTIRHDWTAPGAISTVGVYSLDLFGSRARADMREGRTLLIHDVDAELAGDDGAGMFNQIGIKAIICCPLVKDGRLAAMMAVHQEHPRAWGAGEVALVEAVVERCWAHIERVRSTEALREADRRKSEFLATLAHELRNPLAPIRNGLEIMKMKRSTPASPALLDNVRAMMERQVGHMAHMINDLLDIARVSSGKLVLQVRPVDLREVIATAVETSKPLIDAAGHALEVDDPGVPVPVEVDPVRISQVLSNLLSNAAKYTPQGGCIRLAVRVEGHDVVVTVADDGIGIAADMLGAVFDMFTQAARSIERSHGGLGIGLSLVRRLVELHGGSASASSEGVGRGSTFAVRLPLADAPAADAGAAPGVAAPGRALRVLVADDNLDAAATLSALLQLDGHQTCVVHDGAAAVDAAATFRPELAFLDIGMPRMDGYEAARRLRQMPALDGMLLVALTGWGTDEDRARSRAAGFDRHLLKPAMPDEVQAVLAEAVGAGASFGR